MSAEPDQEAPPALRHDPPTPLLRALGRGDHARASRYLLELRRVAAGGELSPEGFGEELIRIARALVPRLRFSSGEPGLASLARRVGRAMKEAATRVPPHAPALRKEMSAAFAELAGAARAATPARPGPAADGPALDATARPGPRVPGWSRRLEREALEAFARLARAGGRELVASRYREHADRGA